jgi:hypothetical protein
VVCPSETRLRCQPHFIKASASGTMALRGLTATLDSAFGFLHARLLSQIVLNPVNS